jgi:hypothetical protein
MIGGVMTGGLMTGGPGGLIDTGGSLYEPFFA